MRRPPDWLIAVLVAATLVTAVTVAAVADDDPDRAAPPARTPPATSTPSVRPTASPSPTVTKPLYPLPARPAYPKPCPPPPRPPGPPGPPMPPPEVATADLPDPLPVRTQRIDVEPISGKGMWLTTWETSRIDAGEIVERAKAAGLRQLWIRTGGTNQGWYGDRLLTQLLPVAHASGIAVVAWDFPTLSDPVADAVRARRALHGVFAGEKLDAFSPDIETEAEGTYATPKRVRVYLSHVREYAGDRPVVSTVPRPTEDRLRTYPYAPQVRYIDAFAPMIYWSCNEPGLLVDESMAALRRHGRPVHLVGQSYDMGPEGGRRGLPSGREIWRFLDRGKREGGIGASLYLYDQTRRQQWRALAAYPWR